MKTIATIILNRNLPDVTDALYEFIQKQNSTITDIYVTESGSDQDKLSRYCTWWADWEEARKHGLRVARGFNYALSQLWNENRFSQYDYFFMITNDSEFEDKPVVDILSEEMRQHPKVGILTPCCRRWGERSLIGNDNTKYFWDVNNVAYMMRREFILDVMEQENPDYMNFIYDGTNFRGFGTETELIAKGYTNDWATAITTKIWVEENENHLKTKVDLIKTESLEVLEIEYIKEWQQWMRRKYGFTSRWSMQMYVKYFYDKFFEYHPELLPHKI